jgi:N-formylglutamate deformylase
VIGDRFGASAAPVIVDRIEAAFVAHGFRVARNAPFAGAFITQHYGRPSRRQHAVQIELDRSMYMDEATIRPNAAFQEIRNRLRGVVAEIAAIGARDQRLAAE